MTISDHELIRTIDAQLRRDPPPSEEVLLRIVNVLQRSVNAEGSES